MVGLGWNDIIYVKSLSAQNVGECMQEALLLVINHHSCFKWLHIDIYQGEEWGLQQVAHKEISAPRFSLTQALDIQIEK